MNIRIFVAFSLLLSTIALAPSALADGECKLIPQQQVANACQAMESGQCSGGEKGWEDCFTGQCPQEASPDDGSRTSGCAEYVCDAPDWDATTPYGGKDCLDMICRNVPPTFETIKITFLGVGDILGLGGIPGGERVVRIVKNAGFYCETGTGQGGPGSGCQRVLWTPAGSAGADPEAIARTTGETGWECSWAQSGVTGYNYVGDNGSEFVYTNGDCAVDLSISVIMGGDSGYYRFTDSC